MEEIEDVQSIRASSLIAYRSDQGLGYHHSFSGQPLS